MNQIFWVFGAAASGKETFIRNAQNHDSYIISSLGIENENIVVIEESITYIQKSKEDGIVEKRKEIIAAVIKANEDNTNAVILIKGQRTDIYSEYVQELKKELPVIPQKIIFLQVDPLISLERLKKRPWWNGKEDLETRTINVRHTFNLIFSLREFPITIFDTTNGYVFNGTINNPVGLENKTNKK